MIGFQEYVINNKIRISKLAKEININPTCIYKWFRENKVTSRFVKILSQKFNISEEYINKVVNNIDTYQARQKSFNNYEIRGNITALKVVNTKKEEFEIIIDTEDLEKLIKLNYSWHVVYMECTKSYYGRTTIYYRDEHNKRKGRVIYLHQIIMGIIDASVHIDHKNHDTLNNTKNNLRVIEKNKNLKNRQGKNSNNKSGYRNVCWIEDCEKWVVQLQINGKNTMLGKFDDVDEAGSFAEKMRQKYYKEYKGIG
jgi:hypothetical protein